jgi:Ca-activated chloride channel family protein
MLLRGAFGDLSTKGSACACDPAVRGLVLLGLWLISAIAVVGAAEAPRKPREQARFASGVQLVEVYVTVTDRDGHPVSGLTKQDFVVTENGQPQEVTVFTAGEAGLSVAIALDRSFSMAGDRLDAMKRATSTFLDALKPGDRAMLIGIGSTVDVLAPLSTDRVAQHQAARALDPFGSTSLRDAIMAALNRIEPAPGRRALILLSDGIDRYSQTSEADVIARARRGDVLAYPIALNKERPSLFVDLAIATGGHSMQVSDPRRLGDTLTAIARELRQQYLLGYVPAPPAAAGRPEWRGLDVSVRRAGLAVRARPGYWTR